MQKNDMAEKRRLIIEGDEIPGLVSVAEKALEDGVIEVPEFARLRRIRNGVRSIPEVEVVYKLGRDTETLEFFQSWYDDHLQLDVVEVRTDASGTEFARRLWPLTEISRFVDPVFDGAAVEYARLTVTMLPFDILFIRSEV